MRIRIIAFTETGCGLAGELAGFLRSTGDETVASGPARFVNGGELAAYESLSSWTEAAFSQTDALVYVSACGIAVRAIAPYVRDKYRDPAVVCVDEMGRFVVPLLSGHVGGANDLARRLAKACGGTPVISTATDIHGIFAVDEWAAGQDLAILDRMAAKRVSAALISGETVGLVSDYPISGCLPAGIVAEDEGCETGICISLDERKRPFACTLRLAPRVVTIGVGCKRGTTSDRIAELVDRCLANVRVDERAVATLASIDVKADEWGLRALAYERGWDLRFHSARELAAVPGSFSSSEFVRQTVGVDNVCERAACACGEALLLARRSSGGVTVALGAGDPRLSFEELGEREDMPWY